MRRAARRDANEAGIVAALRGLPGCTVIQLSGAGVPDLAVHYGGCWYLAEIKTATGKLRPRQDWGNIIPIWRSLDDALAGIGVTRAD